MDDTMSPSKAGRPLTRKSRKQVSLTMPRRDYEDLITYRDHRHKTISGIFNALWSRYKDEMDAAGEWPPKVLEEGDREFEEKLARSKMRENISE